MCLISLIILSLTLDSFRGALADNVLSNLTEPCYRNTPEFNACALKNLRSLTPHLSKYGIPELGLDSLDPLYLPEMVFDYESLADVGGKMIVSNTTSIGFSQLKINKVKSLLDRRLFSMDIDFNIPKVVLYGKYSMNGRVGLFPVSGKGNYNITTGDVRGVWKLRGHFINVTGTEYIMLNHFGMKPSMSQFKIHADNIVRGNPRLSRLILEFTNRFWSLLYTQSLPYFEKNFDSIGKEMLNKVFLSIPSEELFPHSS